MTHICDELYLGSEDDAMSDEFRNGKPTAFVNTAWETKELIPHAMEIPLVFDTNDRIGQHVERVNEFIDANLQQGSRVLVYSTAGICRSATFVVAYLMYKRRQPFMEVYEYVKSKRNCIDIPFHYIYQLHSYGESLMSASKNTQ